MDNGEIILVWRDEDESERLDKVLSARLNLSRTQLQSWMKAGRVRCGDKALGVRDRVLAGQEISVLPPEVQPLNLQAEDRPLDVLFEDQDFIALNKKAGDVVHPGAGHQAGTLVHALLFHCRGQLSGIGGVERPGVVHRLDRETSGVLLVAKNDLAHQSLAAQFKNRSTEKFYSAFVLGNLPQKTGEWLGPIGRHPVHRQKMAVVENGRDARTRYEVVRTYAKASRLLLQIYTGRTHQIRVHAAVAGCPVVGDLVYGRKTPWLSVAKIDRHLLHAQRMIFSHPRTGKRMEVMAPEPEIFSKAESFLAEN